MFKFLGRSAFARIILFRKEAVTLFHAFREPRTPLYLKLAMIGVVLYVLSPIDLIPDVLPMLGIVDDVMLVGIAVSWIVSKLPQPDTIHTTYRRQ